MQKVEKSFSILSTFEHRDVVDVENNNDNNNNTIIIIDDSKKNTFVLFVFEQQKRWRMF
jgi:hypothetical protein